MQAAITQHFATPPSMISHLIEEAYEVAEALQKENINAKKGDITATSPEQAYQSWGCCKMPRYKAFLSEGGEKDEILRPTERKNNAVDGYFATAPCTKKLYEEIGDLLFSLVNLARHLNIDSDD